MICLKHQPVAQVPFLLSLPHFSQIHYVYCIVSFTLLCLAHGINQYCIISYVLNPIQFHTTPQSSNFLIPYIATAARSILIYHRLQPSERNMVLQFVHRIYITPSSVLSVLSEAHKYFSQYNWAAPVYLSKVGENKSISGKLEYVTTEGLDDERTERNSRFEQNERPYKRSHPRGENKEPKHRARTTPAVMPTEESNNSPSHSKLSCSEFWQSVDSDYFNSSIQFRINNQETDSSFSYENKTTPLSEGRKVR